MVEEGTLSSVLSGYRRRSIIQGVGDGGGGREVVSGMNERQNPVKVAEVREDGVCGR